MDIIGDAAATAPCWQAHRRIGWFEQRWLSHRRWRFPGGAEEDRLARCALKHIVEPDAAMSDAPPLQMLRYVGSRAKHAIQQLRFRPGARSALQTWPWWCRTDRVAGAPNGSVGNGRQQALDWCCERLKGARARRPPATKLDCYQIRSAGETIDCTECGQTAHRRQLPVGVTRIGWRPECRQFELRQDWPSPGHPW